MHWEINRSEMANFGKIIALIFLPISFCSAHYFGAGGAVSYMALLGDFGRDSNGGLSLSLVCGVDLSATENLSILTSFSKLKGRENERLSLSVRSLSIRFLLFPMEEKPYFLKYSIAFTDFQRSIDSHTEYSKYTVAGFGGGVSILGSDQIELLLAIGFSRILERFRAGNIISIDAEFVYHP